MIYEILEGERVFFAEKRVREKNIIFLIIYSPGFISCKRQCLQILDPVIPENDVQGDPLNMVVHQ